MLETRAAKAEEERDSLRLALSFLMQDRAGQNGYPSSVPGANDKLIASSKQNNLQKVAPSSNNISNVNGYATSTSKKKGNQLCPSLSLHNSFAALNDEVGGENGGRQSSAINLDFGYQVAPDYQSIQDSPTPTASSDGAVSSDPVNGHKNQNKQSLLETPQKAKSSMVIIGDSIIKHINPTKLSKRKVYKFTYPGKTASEINNEVNTIDLNQAPSHVIVHAGTNNIPIQSVGECVNDIEKLVIGVHIWRVINNLVYRGKKSSHVGEIRNKHGETIDANDVPNAFNSHFTDLGKILSQNIPISYNSPESFINELTHEFIFCEIT